LSLGREKIADRIDRINAMLSGKELPLFSSEFFINPVDPVDPVLLFIPYSIDPDYLPVS